MRKRVKDLAYKIQVQKEHLTNLCDQLDLDEQKMYSQWEKPKTDSYGNVRIKNGVVQMRTINAPCDSLKAVQSKLLHKVLYEIPLPKYFFGGVKGKDAVKNARIHQGNKYFFQTDFKDFYPSLNSNRVENALRKQGFYPDVARLITRLCTKEGALPQGCPTSSFLAAMVVQQDAGDLLEKIINSGLTLSLYIDDLTISSPLDFKTRTPKIIEDIRSRNFKINFEKTHYCSKNPIVTGNKVLNNGLVAHDNSYALVNDPKLSEQSRLGHQNRIDYVKSVGKAKKKI